MALWWLTKDGDVECLALYERHYSARTYRDGRERRLFVGPGEKIVLRTAAGDAMFVWRRFVDASGECGINCAAFRNESPHQSSELIRQADAIADRLWPCRRHYTYVNPRGIASTHRQSRGRGRHDKGYLASHERAQVFSFVSAPVAGGLMFGTTNSAPGDCLVCGAPGGHGSLPCPSIVPQQIGVIEFAPYPTPRPAGAQPFDLGADVRGKLDRIIELLEQLVQQSREHKGDME